MSQSLKICIGDVSVNIERDNLKGDWEIIPIYRPFIWYGKTDIRLRLHQGVPDNLFGEKIFDCPPVWTLYRRNGTSIIKIFEKLSGLERILVISRQFEKIDLYFAHNSDPFCDPFYGPTMELLMLNYLAQGRGVVIHACGIAKNGKGLLFVGDSGAGKSTIARMWDQEKGVDVLSDDRSILRKKGERFWIYGTPWHGEEKFAEPEGVLLERVFFLRHGERNALNEIKGIDPVSKLLACSFLPHWDPEGMAFSLELFTDLTARIPCQELLFRPDRSILHFVEKITTGEKESPES